MTTLIAQAEQTRRDSEAHSATKVAEYARRRQWSRSDSARWLSARSEPVLARLRRLGRECPAHSHQMGAWLKEVARDRATFDRAHAALLALPNDAAREAAHVLEILR
jgi:hypothetical protein